MTYKRKQLPKYCLHKASGLAYVRIAGDMHYLGKHGSDASRREYDRIIGEFVANGRQAFRHPDEILVESLVVRYLDYTEKEVDYSEGTRSRITYVLRMLNDLYGKQPVSMFGPTALKTFRQQFIDKELSRNTINGYIGIARQLFTWGGGEEIIPADIASALRIVKDLRRGRTTTVDYDEIEPVSDEIVEKTLPHLNQKYQDMARVQRRISGRPQDIFNMRPCDIDQSGEVWVYAPFTYKTQKKDVEKNKSRKLYIGPRAQQILLPYLEHCKDDPEQFVFVNHEGKQFRGGAYADAIASACKRAGVLHWTPNQLRHAGGTEVRNKFGLDHAQIILGHANASTTEIYAKVEAEKAIKVAKEIG